LIDLARGNSLVQILLFDSSHGSAVV
jgi:hypothetical protein